MPNWCENHVILRHKDAREIERVIAAFKENQLLNEFVPCPAELRDAPSGFANAEVKADRLDKYGYESWYDWSVENWGTKWDVGGTEDDYAEPDEHTVVLYFDSAWAPPLEALREMELQGFEVAAMWDEPGLAFCGWYVTGGQEESFHYEGWDVSTARKNIPEKIDGAFGIVERLENYEEEMNNEDD